MDELRLKEGLYKAEFLSKKYSKYPGDQMKEDYYQIACIGLLKADKTFDESKGYSFKTYANRCMENEILMYKRLSKPRNENLYEKCDVVTLNNDYEFEDVIDNLGNLDKNYDDIDFEGILPRAKKKAEDVLTPAEKKYFLGYLEGKTQYKMAEETERTRSFVCRCMRNVRRKMKIAMYNEFKEFIDIKIEV